MKYVLNQKQMQTVDRYSMDHMGISALFLMEQAARSVAKAIQARFSKENAILIVVESGNNGGDGLALARILKENEYDVTVYYIHGIEHVSDSFTEQMKLAMEKDVLITEEIPADARFDVVVDGIFGVGLKRMVRGIHARVIDWMNRLTGYKVAIDIPSGIHATTGDTMGTVFCADLTVTFGYLKMGLVLYPGSDMAGEVLVEEIGFPEESLRHARPSAVTFGSGTKAVHTALSYYPARENRSNKGTYGNVLLIVGSKGMAGAACIAAKAAYRCGCGLVRVLTHSSNREIIQIQVPEAVVLSYTTLQEAYDLLDANWKWADAVLIGSGMGLGETARKLTHAVVTYGDAQKGSMPVVVDGDALRILAEESGIWEEYQSLPLQSRPYLTLTPHVKEMSRLCGKDTGKIAARLMDTANQYIRRNRLQGQMTVVLKDARTIVTDGKSPTYINMTGNHGMATAGSGDCLAGMLISLLAQQHRQKKGGRAKETMLSNMQLLPVLGNPLQTMACAGVCLHGAAGDVARKRVGTIGMMAMDIVDAIPEVLKAYDKIK
ncbi:MAG: NAD(P)H-hydrate dehydratase [Lachnospiraceae bacterium]|nr:NAD(P)H-hydrate dehydratase [Lachnospiraceae bacterium]